MDDINEKIRDLRIQKELTLKDLSEKTGLSISFLSQVERGTSSLAITSLKKIADALDVPITYFFEGEVNQSFVVKAWERKSIKIEGSIAKYSRLGGEFSGRLLEPMLVELEPNNKSINVFSHPGEEFYYVLEGEIVFVVDDREYVLKAGDTIHYPSNLPHYWYNPLDRSAFVLCVLTPAIF